MSFHYSPLICWAVPTIFWALLAKYWIWYKNVSLRSSLIPRYLTELKILITSFPILMSTCKGIWQTVVSSNPFYACPDLCRGNPTMFSFSVQLILVFAELLPYSWPWKQLQYHLRIQPKKFYSLRSRIDLCAAPDFICFTLGPDIHNWSLQLFSQDYWPSFSHHLSCVCRVFAKNLLRGHRRRNTFFLFCFDVWPGCQNLD